MNTKIITRVNNVDIVSTSDEQLVAIKPICEALGIDSSVQYQKIKEHPILSSFWSLSPLTGKDGKEYKMFCLPSIYIFVWLFTINSKNVNKSASPNVIKFQETFMELSFNVFGDKAVFVAQHQQEVDKQLKLYKEAKAEYNKTKAVLNNANQKLQKLRNLTMDDFDVEQGKFKMPYE